MVQFSGSTSNIDYHVEFERHYYSVPYALVRQQVEIRYTEQNTSWRSCTGASGWPRIVATACQEPPLPAPSTVHSVTGVIWSGLLRG